MLRLKYITACLFLCSVLTACFDTAPEISVPAGYGQFFVLNNSPHKQISVPDESGDLLPWTEQLRVSDYTAAGDYLYLAVNKAGILEIPLENPDIDSMILYQDEKYISGNTMKKIFYYKGYIYCHLYRDSFFSGSCSGSSASPLIRLDRRESKFVSEFEKNESMKNRETVDFIFSNDKWVSSWKYSDENSSSFRYFSHDINGGNIAEISESEYRHSIDFEDDSEKADPVLDRIQTFLLKEENPAAIIDLYIKEADCISGKTLRFNIVYAEAGTYSLIPVYKTEGNYYFTVNNSIYKISSKGEIILYDIKPLPEGFNYTGICAERGNIFLFWEYQSFFNTGNSGFSIIDEKRVEKITI